MPPVDCRGLSCFRVSPWALLRARCGPLGMESGAVVVEAALVVVVLVSLISGIVEIGSLSRSRISLERLAWSAARVTAMDTGSPSSDLDVLKAVGESLEAAPGSVLRRVVVFRSDTASGTPSSGCQGLRPEGTAASGVPGQCNVYGPDHVNAAVSLTSIPTGCAPPSWEAAWCPASRVRSLPEPDHAGVLIEVEQLPTAPGLFTIGVQTVSATAVVKLEPEVR